jgi:pyridoxine 5-phosphate synthase
MLLGVNIDHIAVLREARKVNDPNPLDAVGICQNSGADQITIHLREDRRHIVDSDAYKIVDASKLPVNLECSINSDIIDIVCDINPMRATLVPENREEVTTEGGLDIVSNYGAILKVVEKLQANDIEVSLFIDPNEESIKLSNELAVEWIELHTGSFANIYAMLYSNLSLSHHRIDSLSLSRTQLKEMLDDSISSLEESAKLAKDLGLNVAAGHGINYQNIKMIKKIQNIDELNIGQSIIARSVFSGLESAIVEMKNLIN